jgi:dipeptidyl-peptidase 4
VPNMYHGEGGNMYLVRRRWDYFVQNLMGLKPPEGVQLHEDREPPPQQRRR